MEKFLNQKAIRDAIGVGDIYFLSSSITIYQAMLVDWMRNLEVGIPTLLEDGIYLLVYAGEYDLICNWLNVIQSGFMQWNGLARKNLSTRLKFPPLLMTQKLEY
ncbi:Serine carboxypeptidase-like 49, variant 2 [Stylosanthes scabra]|uniref:Serine carboxypeptidase-like 49, variant 2 n=1 Tax=Stylosanthes scabra TaxID=79078 RepID=A0ABU6WF63_9FABA|nr:Serine carboxypeptidase-like 49, variant 2 [Stylosanthes scabra]